MFVGTLLSAMTLSSVSAVMETGLQSFDVSVDGGTRDALLYVPEQYTGEEALPVIFNWHGAGSTGLQQLALSYFNRLADNDATGFFVVYPNGIGNTHNGGNCCKSGNDVTDDVAFTSTMLDYLESNLNVNANKVYSTGMSNGGFMSMRLGCELSERITAISSVTGAVGDLPGGREPYKCELTHPMPVFNIHGTSDGTVPYEGSAQAGWRSAKDGVEYFRELNEVTDSFQLSYANRNATCESAGEGLRNVTLCTMDGFGHVWPGGFGPIFTGPDDLETSEEIVEFFLSKSL